jgi:alpha-amylase/alpha-mannosidase (GH57 family)
VAPRIAVHGHFYQPPRENPWTGNIDEQPSAAPFHDWNERVHSESYRPNAFARIPSPDGEVTVNNFERLSFNVGPTLLQWMEQADPATYARILEADRASVERLGHGSAIAQSYHHTILPLSPSHDVRTQVRWGVADFRHRFGREPEGIWLPETAANDDTLAILIEEGVTFTILAAKQASRWREGTGPWTLTDDRPLDPRLPYRYFHRDGSGRSLILFFYDLDIARAIAFERAGSSAEGFIELFEARAEEPLLVHAATDGETYGHHHVFSELGLAYALFVEAEKRGLEVTNYAAYLEDSEVTHEVAIWRGEGTAWSCAHGLGRWIRDCGCSTGGEEGWDQRWRGPLRSALDVVKQAADEIYERMGPSVLLDPWVARDEYVQVILGAEEPDEFVTRHAAGPLSDEERARALDLLELQRNAMSMYTSCGWFFSDIGGIETVQVLRYAGRTMDIMDSLGQSTPEQAFLSTLETSRSNKPERGTGADIYRASVSVTAG